MELDRKPRLHDHQTRFFMRHNSEGMKESEQTQLNTALGLQIFAHKWGICELFTIGLFVNSNRRVTFTFFYVFVLSD